MSETFYTTVDDQKRVEVETFQGENPIASENTLIGSFLLDLPRKLPEGSEIDVTFEYDLNGTVTVSARDRASGAKRAARYDVNRLADADSPRPEVVAPVAPEGMSRGKCERILRSARKKSNRFGMDSALAGKIREQADRLENALAEGRADAAALAEELAELIAGI